MSDQILSDNHWRIPDFRQRITTKQWKQLLLDENDRIIFKGHIRPLKAKSLGAGVVEITKDFSS